MRHAVLSALLDDSTAGDVSFAVMTLLDEDSGRKIGLVVGFSVGLGLLLIIGMAIWVAYYCLPPGSVRQQLLRLANMHGRQHGLQSISIDNCLNQEQSQYSVNGVSLSSLRRQQEVGTLIRQSHVYI